MGKFRFPDPNFRQGTRELLCVVTTEDPDNAEGFAEMMKEPGEAAAPWGGRFGEPWWLWDMP